MKLSEAIRIGALRYAPSEDYFKRNSNGEVTACCALGGACLAAGHNPNSITEMPWDFYIRTWPILLQETKYPGKDKTLKMGSIIHWLNTSWTREQIADWVETIEAKESRT